MQCNELSFIDLIIHVHVGYVPLCQISCNRMWKGLIACMHVHDDVMLHHVCPNIHVQVGKHVLPFESHFLAKFLGKGYSGVARWCEKVRVTVHSD